MSESWEVTELVICPDCQSSHDLGDCWFEEDEDLVLFPVDRLCLPCWHEITIERCSDASRIVPVVPDLVCDSISTDVSHIPTERIQYYFGREALPEQTEEQIREVMRCQ